MIADTLKALYLRDLTQLKQEITLYQKEENIWRIDRSVLNSAGNLCLHLIGNLNTYIGAELGNTGYVRNRPEEFSLKNIPREELISNLDKTMTMIETVISSLSEDRIESEYLQPVLDGRVSTSHFLVHLATHLSYHLGQVNYHRRLLDY